MLGRSPRQLLVAAIVLLVMLSLFGHAAAWATSAVDLDMLVIDHSTVTELRFAAWHLCALVRDTAVAAFVLPFFVRCAVISARAHLTVAVGEWRPERTDELGLIICRTGPPVAG